MWETNETENADMTEIGFKISTKFPDSMTIATGSRRRSDNSAIPYFLPYFGWLGTFFAIIAGIR
jgi:hypothetical protein